MAITLQAIHNTAQALGRVSWRTPIEYSAALSNMVGVPVYLKCENLQRGGSFKIRGAYTRMKNLTEEEKQRGVLAASAGNHAQGVALAAAHLGIDATVYMPTSAAIPKVEATQG
ncbi:MAG TPA: pyridoxal-phosphate dependent enzyme, partial [Beutenbergiaceae bacterium]|nr:pyridoxal-phosphate dependent enzyme [Beutenbergiaceae bacterium]